MNIFSNNKKHKVQYSLVEINDYGIDYPKMLYPNIEKYPNYKKKLGCPAVTSVDNRYFNVNSFVEAKIIVGYKDGEGYYRYEFDESYHPTVKEFKELLDASFLISVKENLVTFQVVLPYVFITDSELNITTLPPNIETENVSFVLGSYSIKDYIRTINGAWVLIDNNKEGIINLKINKPVMNVLFDKPVDLYYAEITNEQKKYYENNLFITSYRKKIVSILDTLINRRPKKLL